MVLAEKNDTTNIFQTSLYSFDPATMEADKILAAQDGSRFTSVGVAPDGKIWVFDQGLGKLINYNLVTDDINTYSGYSQASDDFANEYLGDVTYLYFDRIGHLWLGDIGWLDFNTQNAPVWHKIIRSSAFITDAASPENQFVWYRPYQIYQSSDGLYWFTSYGGLVSLDQNTGKWCHFTTGVSPVVEDDKGYLWIAVYGKIYRYNLSP